MFDHWFIAALTVCKAMKTKPYLKFASKSVNMFLTKVKSNDEIKLQSYCMSLSSNLFYISFLISARLLFVYNRELKFKECKNFNFKFRLDSALHKTIMPIRV